MRVLLDECVDQRLRNHLARHECHTAVHAGFAGLQNGQLLKDAEAAKFDVVLTVDRGFEFEQNLSGRRIAFLILRTKSIRLKDLLPHLSNVLLVLESIQAGRVVGIE